MVSVLIFPIFSYRGIIVIYIYMYNSNTYLQLRYPIVRHHRCSSRHLRHTPQSTRTHPRLKLVAMPRRSDSRTRVRHIRRKKTFTQYHTSGWCQTARLPVCLSACLSGCLFYFNKNEYVYALLVTLALEVKLVRDCYEVPECLHL